MSEQQEEQPEPEQQPDMNQLMREATGRGGAPTATADMNDWLRGQVHSRRRRIPAWEPPPDDDEGEGA